MATNKQRRETARRKLERQLEARQDRARRRRKGNVIASVVGALVVIGVVAAILITSNNGSKKSTAATSTTPAPTATATTPTTPPTSPSATKPKVAHTPLPTRKAAVIARAPKKTAGPCGYTEDAATLKSGTAFDVGLPPDPKPTPTATRTAVFATNLGNITVALTAKSAPCNVQSIAYLISKKFYNDTACPRSVNSGIFVVQCGDPSGTTGGGPSYKVKDENLKTVTYPAGSIAMANSGPNTNGSQFFFITKDSSKSLGKNYTVIGHVTKGLNVLQKVAASGDDGSNQAGGGRPNTDLIFKTVRLTA